MTKNPYRRIFGTVYRWLDSMHPGELNEYTAALLLSFFALLGYGGVARHAEHWSGYPMVTEAKKWGMVFFATIVVIHYFAFIRGDRLAHVTLECDESAAEAVLTLSYVIGMSTLLLTSY